jgi:hypothetical protein
MAWDHLILKSFAKVDPNETVEAYWYGPYNMLLNYFFPFVEDYEVAPQFILPPYKAIGFMTMYLVSVGSHPIFFLKVKPTDYTALYGCPLL